MKKREQNKIACKEMTERESKDIKGIKKKVKEVKGERMEV